MKTDCNCVNGLQFLMDARLAIPTPRRLSFEEAAGVGVGTEVIP